MTDAASQTITLNAFLPAATVNGVVKSADELADLLENPFSEGTTIITLADDLELAEGITITIENGASLEIDLNGNTITPADGMPAFVNNGTLKVTDSGTGGTVEGALIGEGLFDLRAGKYLDYPDGFTDANEINWKFSNLAFAENGFTRRLDGGYWTVTAAPTTFAVTYEAGNFTISNGDDVFTSGSKLANGTYIFTVEATAGYKVDSVTVGGVLAQVAADGTFSVTVNGADVVIVVTTSEKSLYPESEELVNGEVTADVTAALGELAAELGGGDDAVTNYIIQVCGGNVDAATLTAAKTAGTIGISVYFKLPLMKENAKFVAEPSTTTDGYSAAFEFTLKNGDESALVLTQAVLENVLEMIKVGSDLNSFGNATPADVDTSITAGGKLKVQLKTKNGVTKGFMKISAAKPTPAE